METTTTARKSRQKTPSSTYSDRRAVLSATAAENGLEVTGEDEALIQHRERHWDYFELHSKNLDTIGDDNVGER